MVKAATRSAFQCLVFLSCSIFAAQALTGQNLEARGLLSLCEDGGHVGFIQLEERASEEGVKQVDVFVRALGLPPGKHAVHIHETAECSPCGAAGGHFDPGPESNSSPDGNHPFHSGDLINLDINPRGSGALFTTTTRFTLSAGPLSIFDEDGAAVIVHIDPDSYCPEGEEAGCAGGGRLACGVLGLQ